MRKVSLSSNTNKRAIHVLLSDGVLAQGKVLQTNVPQAAEVGVEQAHTSLECAGTDGSCIIKNGS